MQSQDREGEPGPRRQRLLVLAICIAFTVVGTALILGDDPGAWVTGLVAVVFFGGGGLVYWGLTAPRGQGGPPDVATAHDEGVMYPTSMTRAALRSAGSGVLVAVGIVMMFSPALVSASIFPPSVVSIVGTVCVLFFSMVLFLAAIPSLLRPGGLVLTPDRIAYHSGLSGFSGRWSDIDDVQTVRAGMLGLRATEARLLHTRGLLRLLSPLQHRFWGVHVVIPLQMLRTDPETVEAAVVESHGANGK